jgi:hypothetical protein
MPSDRRPGSVLANEHLLQIAQNKTSSGLNRAVNFEQKGRNGICWQNFVIVKIVAPTNETTRRFPSKPRNWNSLNGSAASCASKLLSISKGTACSRYPKPSGSAGEVPIGKRVVWSSVMRFGKRVFDSETWRSDLSFHGETTTK